MGGHAHMIYKFNLQDAELRGIAIGEERGIAIGEERGKQRAKIRIAKNMLRENFPDDLISELTGLPISEINKLKAAPQRYLTA